MDKLNQKSKSYFRSSLAKNEKNLFKNLYRNAIDSINTDFCLPSAPFIDENNRINEYNSKYPFFMTISNIYYGNDEQSFKVQDLITKEIISYLTVLYSDERKKKEKSGTYIKAKKDIIDNYDEIIFQLAIYKHWKKDEVLKENILKTKKECTAEEKFEDNKEAKLNDKISQDINISIIPLDNFFKNKGIYEKLVKCLIEKEVLDINLKLLPQIGVNDLIAIFCQLHMHNYININRRQNKLCEALTAVFGRTIDQGQFSAMKKKVEDEYEYKTRLPKHLKDVYEKYSFIHDYLKE